MATRYGGLKHWQWAIVVALALGNALTTPVYGLAGLFGAMFGSLVFLYLIARLIVYLNSRWGKQDTATAN